MTRLVVLETNEIPLRVHEWFAAREPDSAIASILRTGSISSTTNHDECDGRELYPSQTWATIATGLPFSEHGIYWYADPKPVDAPMYWQLAAEHRTVGLVGVLHTSPLDRLRSLPNLAFCVPDIFAENDDTEPTNLRPLQRFSIAMANRNSRSVQGSTPRLLFDGCAAVLRARIRPRTVASLTRLVGDILRRRVPAERLRIAQFELSSDVFERLLDREDPDLAVFFTNHVASAMHRYWYATFPDDWDGDLFDDDWVERYEDEILEAMRALDRFVARMLDRCAASGRSLVLVSSMGQSSAGDEATSRHLAFVVHDERRFLETIGVPGEWAPRAGMAPQVSAAFADDDGALAASRRLASDWAPGSGLEFDVSGAVLTVTYRPEIVDSEKVVLGGEHHHPSDLGGSVRRVDDSRNGEHHPEGALLVWPRVEQLPDSIDARDFAPAVLATLDLAAPDHLREPGLRFG